MRLIVEWLLYSVLMLRTEIYESKLVKIWTFETQCSEQEAHLLLGDRATRKHAKDS